MLIEARNRGQITITHVFCAHYAFRWRETNAKNESGLLPKFQRLTFNMAHLTVGQLWLLALCFALCLCVCHRNAEHCVLDVSACAKRRSGSVECASLGLYVEQISRLRRDGGGRHPTVSVTAGW